MRLRHLAICTLALGLVASASPAATAATKKKKPPKPLCFLLTDVEGDGRSTIMPGVEGPELDILGGDVATGPKTLVAMLRVKSTTGGTPWSKLGNSVSMTMNIRGTVYSFQRRRAFGMDEKYTYSFSGGSQFLKSTAVTPTTITWTVDRAGIPELKKLNTVITGLAASSQPFTSNADGAGSNKSYPDKHPSCVRAS